MQPRVAEFIPTDIIGLIIDEVALADKELGTFKSVKACSLTCHAFLQHCRRHLFADTHVDDAGKLLNLCRLLKDSPWIGHYVRSLRIGLQSLFVFKQSLLPVHHHLKHVDQPESIIVNGHLSQWTDIPLSVRSTILHLLHLPTVVAIGLIKITNVSPSDLAPCNLRTLMMNKASFKEEDGPLQPIKCHKLYLNDHMPVHNWIDHLLKGKSVIDPNILKGICLSVNSSDQGFPYSQLLAEIPFVEELDLRISDTADRIFPAILADPPPALKYLKIRIRVSNFYNMTRLVSKLKKVANAAGHLVQHLSFNVISGSVSIARFPLIQDVLGDPSKWPALRRLSLRVYLRSPWPIVEGLTDPGWDNDLKLRLYNFLENRHSRFQFFHSITNSWTEHYYDDEGIEWQEMPR